MGGAARASLGLVLLAVACASAETSGSGPNDSENRSPGATETAGFELAVGVVVAPSASKVYLARPGGGIEALEAMTGELLWSSGAAARPLIVGDGRLLAQRETGAGLPLALLDAASGDLLRGLEFALPEGVRAAIDESLEGHFRISARALGEDAMLEWEYLERHALGVAPPEGRPFARRERGALRLDLDSGEATELHGEGSAAEAGESLPEAVARLLTTGELAAAPWQVGEVFAAAQQRHEPAGSRLLLRRWRADNGEALPEVALMDGRPVAVLAAADGRHLLVVSPQATTAEPRGGYLWAIHSLADGELVASRHAERSAAPFCVLPGTLLHIEPPSGRRVEGRWEERPHRLRAVELGSGAELWQRPVRDPVFRGPAPPRP